MFTAGAGRTTFFLCRGEAKFPDCAAYTFLTVGACLLWQSKKCWQFHTISLHLHFAAPSTLGCNIELALDHLIPSPLFLCKLSSHDHSPLAFTYSQVSYFCGHYSAPGVTDWSYSKACIAYLLMGLHQPKQTLEKNLRMASLFTWTLTCGIRKSSILYFLLFCTYRRH